MKLKTKRTITPAQIKQIFGDEYPLFKKIESNVFCGHCNDDHVTTIVDYHAYVLDNYDLLLKGKCKKCGSDVARVLETGEVEENKKNIQSILSEE